VLPPILLTYLSTATSVRYMTHFTTVFFCLYVYRLYHCILLIVAIVNFYLRRIYEYECFSYQTGSSGYKACCNLERSSLWLLASVITATSLLVASGCMLFGPSQTLNNATVLSAECLCMCQLCSVSGIFPWRRWAVCWSAEGILLIRWSTSVTRQFLSV